VRTIANTGFDERTTERPASMGASQGLTLCPVAQTALTASGRSKGRSEWPDDPVKTAPMRLLHTMLQSGDLVAPRLLTTGVLGMTLLRRRDFPRVASTAGLRGTTETRTEEPPFWSSPQNWDTSPLSPS